MFNQDDFKVFEDQTLEGRLSKIRTIIDPKFEILGEELLAKYQDEFDEQLYVHIAKHIRRHKNPPPDTWLAISSNKRGYKALPHIEIGLWPENFYLNLSFLAELEDRKGIISKIKKLDFSNKELQISNDHTTNVMHQLTDSSLTQALDKYLMTKNKDLVIGYRYPKETFRYDQLIADCSTIFELFAQI